MFIDDSVASFLLNVVSFDDFTVLFVIVVVVVVVIEDVEEDGNWMSDAFASDDVTVDCVGIDDAGDGVHDAEATGNVLAIAIWLLSLIWS